MGNREGRRVWELRGLEGFSGCTVEPPLSGGEGEEGRGGIQTKFYLKHSQNPL